MALENVTQWLTTALMDDSVSCKSVNEQNHSLQCNFIMNTDDCEYDGVFFDYTKMTYCTFSHERPVAIVLLVSLLLLLFICMGTIADDFMCPSLLTVSKMFRLPDHIAGVTFLAFGNGAPDIFSSIGGIAQAKPQLIISSLYGGGIFVTTLVTGAVVISGDFALMKRPILRDIIFYIGAGFIAWFFVFSNIFNLFKATSLIAFYIAYIVAVVVGRYVYVRMNPPHSQRSDSDEIAVIDPEVSSNNNNSSDTVDSRKSRALSYDQSSVVLTRYNPNGTNRSKKRTKSDVNSNSHAVHHHFENSIIIVSNMFEQEYQTRAKEARAETDSVVEPKKEYPNGKPKPFVKQDSVLSILSRESVVSVFNETRDFISHIAPIDKDEFMESAWYSKILSVVKAVPYFIMTISIPVVDLESKNENWCRLLICTNMIFAPQVTLYLLKKFSYKFGGVFPLWGACLIGSLILSVVILLTSEKNKPPIYHRAFSLIGFTVSVIFINSTADEIISILQTSGIIFDLSDSILGLTVLAWGNSLGDLIADTALAKAGYPAMAISACYAGPMLNLLMGLGIPYTVMFTKHNAPESVDVEYNNMITLLFVTLTSSLVISLFYFVFNRFRSSKIHGFILIGLYVIYTIIAFLLEYNVLPNGVNSS